MDVPADEDAFSDEAHALERAERAIVARVRVRADPLQPQTPESEREDQRLRLRVGPAAPIRPAEPRPDYGSPVASGELGQPGDSDRPVVLAGDHEFEPLAGLALLAHALDERARLPRLAVRTPREEARHVGIAAELIERWCVVGPRIAQRQAGPAEDHRLRSACAGRGRSCAASARAPGSPGSAPPRGSRSAWSDP